MKFPKIFPTHTGPFPARDWRAHLALIASILGSVALTAFSAIMVYILWKGGWPVETAVMRLEILGDALILSRSGSLVVLVSLGFDINRRSVKISRDGLEASGGEDSEDIDEKV
jgi:hypothetical protein